MNSTFNPTSIEQTTVTSFHLTTITSSDVDFTDLQNISEHTNSFDSIQLSTAPIQQSVTTNFITSYFSSTATSETTNLLKNLNLINKTNILFSCENSKFFLLILSKDLFCKP